jgi:hypothetical protein
MRNVIVVVAIAGAVGAAVACGSGAIERVSDDGTSPGVDEGGAVLPTTGPAGSGLVSGLPCDVEALVADRCIACHAGAQPGTPKLSEYGDFVVPSKGFPGKNMAEAAVLRMKSTTSPMPPPPAEPPAPDEVQTMEAWVNGGLKHGGMCSTTPPASDASAPPPPHEAGADAAPPCSSGTFWTQGNTGSPLMHPGGACSNCHQQLGGPRLRFGGTVYRAPHDVNDCNGAAPPPTITVTVTDKDGMVLTATVNGAGNFDVIAIQGNGNGNGNGNGQSNRLNPPYSAKLSDGTNTRVMKGTVNSGDCNSCHTDQGINGAPGRILAPAP